MSNDPDATAVPDDLTLEVVEPVAEADGEARAGGAPEKGKGESEGAGAPAGEGAGPPDGESAGAPEGGSAGAGRRRRWFGRRRTKHSESEPVPELEAREEPVRSEYDWNAIVTGESRPEVNWSDWSVAVPPAEPAPDPATAEAPDEFTAAVWETLSETPPAPATPPEPVPPGPYGADGSTGALTIPPTPALAAQAAADVAEAEEERRYRTTPSWPPPRKPRIAAGFLSLLVVAVMVMLLVTNGAMWTSDDEREGAKGEGLPALNTDPKAVPADWIVYRDQTGGFGISYPPGWKVQDQGRIVQIRDPATNAELVIGQRRPPGGTDPEDNWIEQERAFTSRASGYRRLQLSAATYQGHNAALWEYVYSDAAGAIHAADLEFVTKKDRFTLNFRGPVTEWQRLLPTFQGFLSSFKVPK